MKVFQDRIETSERPIVFIRKMEKWLFLILSIRFKKHSEWIKHQYNHIKDQCFHFSYLDFLFAGKHF